jgi:hypothetical protein
MEAPPRRVTNPYYLTERPGARARPVEMAGTVTHVQTTHLGRVLVLVPQIHNLSTETRQEVLTTETFARLHGGKMTAIVLLTVNPTIPLMKRVGNLTHITRSLAMTYVIGTMTGTDATITPAKIALTGPAQEPQGCLPRTNPWTAPAQATGSLMTLILVAFIPVTVTPHLSEMIALAVSCEGMIIMIMIRLTKVLGIMMTHLVAALGQQSVLDTPNPSMGAPIPSSRGNITPRIRVQVDHRL